MLKYFDELNNFDSEVFAACEKEMDRQQTFIELIASENIVSKAVSSSTTLDILKGIKIDANENLKLTGSDLDLSIESICDADIREEGSLILDARILSEIIRKLPDGNVEFITTDKNEIKITCANTKFNILYLSSEGYPEIKKVEEGDKIKIYSRDLRDVIKNTLFAVSNNESRPVLTGSKFEISKSNMRVVSIDGSRLALRNLIIPETDFEDLSFVVPGRVLNELLKILKDDETIVEINIKNNSVMFNFESFTIIARLLEGEFFDYTKAIPSVCEIKAEVDIKDFTDMVERASIIINYDDPKIPVVLNIVNSQINVECISKRGNFNESLIVDKQGKDLRIGIDSRLLLDALKSIEHEKAIFEFNTEVSPCVIKPVEGDSFIYMVLPRRL